TSRFGTLVIVSLAVRLQVVPGIGPPNPIVEGEPFVIVNGTGPVAVQMDVPPSLTTRPFKTPVPVLPVTDMIVKVAGAMVTAGQSPGPVLVPPVIVPPAAPAGRGGVGSAGPVLPLIVKVQLNEIGGLVNVAGPEAVKSVLGGATRGAAKAVPVRLTAANVPTQVNRVLFMVSFPS
ncbi:MAG: hypothetical protein ACRERT_01330, partial [Pseudomonas sp.]